jgi:D-xylulose reductase
MVNSETTQISFVLKKKDDLAFEETPIPTLQTPHDCLVEVKYTGICGSDVHYWTHGSIGKYVLEAPMVLGHESSGIIVEIGSAVTSLKKGDRVAMEPGVPCRYCRYCMEGKYNLCLNVKFAATPPYHGTLTKYYVLPEDFCHKLPENVSLEEGAVVEPLSVAVHVCRRAGIKPSTNVVIFGAGPIGLLCAAVAKAFGASKIINVDIQQNRLDFALKYAATNVFLPSKDRNAIENAKKIIAENDLGDGADYIIEASGAPQSIFTGIHVARPNATYVQVGCGNDVVEFPIMATLNELNFKGSFRYGPGDYNLAIGLLRDKKVSVKELITKMVSFTDAEQAFMDVKNGKGIKTIIKGVNVQ